MLIIIISSVLAFVAIVAPLLSIYMRRQRFCSPDAESEKKPVSVILTVQDNAKKIEQNLQAYLEQDYEAGYEVIVVCAKSEDGTEDALKRYADNPRLYTTFIPDSSRYISRKKLAMTLGVKAAHNPWLIFTDITCRPVSNKWIKTMAECLGEDKNIVIGPTVYDEESPLFWRFQRLNDDISLTHEYAFGTAYRAESKNILMLRDEFIEGRAFEGNMKYARGEHDFTVNKYAKKKGTAVTDSEDALMIENEPTRKEWRNHRLFYMETRRHLKRTFSHRFPIFIDMLFFHLSLLLPIAAIVYAILTNNLPIIIAGASALLITIVLRTLIASRRIRQTHCPIPAWRIIPLEIRLAWHKLNYWIAYKKADKYDFITHKI